MSNDLNPFESPQANEQPRRPSSPKPGVCPYCGSTDFREPKFTWWGGAIGHKIINHVICNHCSRGFNSKHGTDNAMAIVLYNVVAFVIIFPLALIFFYMLFNA